MEQRFFPEVLCPGCNAKMSVKMILPPREDVKRMEAVVYHCGRCDVETTRHFILSAAAQGQGNAARST
jgi:hypothetical protein